jgi:hypothetical protein
VASTGIGTALAFESRRAALIYLPHRRYFRVTRAGLAQHHPAPLRPAKT